jgi:tetratricopeptide (TPR) repeat protein
MNTTSSLVRNAIIACAVVMFMSGAQMATWAADPAAPPVPPSSAELLKSSRELLDQLKAAKDAAAAQAIERRVWEVWVHSGNGEVDTLLDQGIALMQSGRLELALATFDAVVVKMPEFAEGWNKRATVHYMMGALDNSLADIDRVLALEPRHFGALSGIGLIRMAQGDKKAALAAYRRVIEVSPFAAGALASVKALSKELEGDPI